MPAELCPPLFPRAVRSAAGACGEGSSPAPPSPGFPQAKAIKRVIRVLKTDVNNGEEAVVTAEQRGRFSPGKRLGAPQHPARGPGEGRPADPAALEPLQKGMLTTHWKGPFALQSAPEHAGQGSGQKGLRGGGGAGGSSISNRAVARQPPSTNAPTGALASFPCRPVSKERLPHPRVPHAH